jgi:hypothetical protein
MRLDLGAADGADQRLGLAGGGLLPRLLAVQHLGGRLPGAGAGRRRDGQEGDEEEDGGERQGAARGGEHGLGSLLQR